MKRTILTSKEEITERLPQWLGRDFAFDVETTGLNYRGSALLGLALTFDGNDSYYICLAHTKPEEQTVAKTVEVEEFDKYIEEEYYTPKRKIRKTRLVPQYKKLTKTVEETVTVYPCKHYIEEWELADVLQPLFDQRNVLALAHNMKFDLHFLYRAGFRIRTRIADTMLAAQLIDENRDVGLKKLAYLVDMDLSEYMSLEHYPGFAKEAFLGVPLEPAAEYAMMDTECTYALWFDTLQYRLVEEGVAPAFSKLWMPLMLVLQEMENSGIGVDLARVEELRAEYVAKRDAHYDFIMQCGMEMVNAWYGTVDVSEIPSNYMRMSSHEEEGFLDGRRVFRLTPRSNMRELHFNPASSHHLADLLYRWYGMQRPTDVTLSTTTKEPTDKTILKIWQMSLGDQCPEVINHILEYKAAEKFISTYLDRILTDVDRDNHDTIYTNFNQARTDTGRLSSSQPNLQNQPSRGERGKQARSIFIARPGRALIVADYSSMELRMAAHYAAKIDPNHTMMQAFAEDLDLHALTASQQFNVAYDELLHKVEANDVEAKLQRMIGKTSNFGLLYGMGPKKFQTYLWVECGVHLELEQVAALIQQFNDTYLAITQWKEWVVECAKRLGYVQTIGGRKRRLPDLYSHDRYLMMKAERQAVNAVIQGSCADIINEAMPYIQRDLKKIKGTLLLQVHDEVVAEVPHEYAEEAKSIVETHMTQHINPRLRCPLVAEAGIGLTWGESKG